MRSYLVSILLVIQFVLISIFLLQQENRQLIKSFLLRSDAVFFDGALRRLYRKQKVPDVKAVVQTHDADDYYWFGTDPFLVIAHGLGPQLYGGDNTIKTLEKGRDRGFRIFEVDVSLTADNVLVCYHGGSEQEINEMQYSDYLAICRTKGVMPCHFYDIVKYAQLHSNIYFVLDVKNRFFDAYEMIRKIVSAHKVGKSFIPQIYDFDQLPCIRKDRLFAGEIFTSYRSALTNKQIFDYAKKYDIKVVTLTMPRLLEQNKYFPQDAAVFVHPVNDPFIAAQVKSLGVRGIYTSYITRNTVPELF